MNRLKFLIKKYYSIISYLFFGVCTTIVNVAIYNICYDFMGISNVISTIVAWFVAVVFAFITNKWFVFESKTCSLNILRHELVSFFGCRFLTGILDVAIMFVAVDFMGLPALIWKIVSNILVIILNYFASKLLIFKK